MSTPTVSKIRKAVLPVAGMGTRVLPATKTIPKEMLPVFDRPSIQYVVDEAREAGIEHLVFVTGRNKGAIEDYFDRAYELEDSLQQKGKTAILQELAVSQMTAGSASFVRQQSPQGLGHAVWCARDVIGNEPFAVLLPDVIIAGQPGCLKQMVDAYNQVGGNMIAVDPVPMEHVSRYGVIAPGTRDGRRIQMTGMVEKPRQDLAPSNLAITGRYILQPEIFGLLEDQNPGAGGEIQLTDAMARLMGSQPFHAFEFAGRPYDCGDKIGYLTATIGMALERPEFADEVRAVLARFLAEKAS